jgi:hypothetical protein
MKGRANFTSFIEFPSARNWEGYYAYSSRVERKLCLLIGVRTLPLMRSIV